MDLRLCEISPMERVLQGLKTPASELILSPYQFIDPLCVEASCANWQASLFFFFCIIMAGVQYFVWEAVPIGQLRACCLEFRMTLLLVCVLLNALLSLLLLGMEGRRWGLGQHTLYVKHLQALWGSEPSPSPTSVRHLRALWGRLCPFNPPLSPFRVLWDLSEAVPTAEFESYQFNAVPRAQGFQRLELRLMLL